MISLFRLIGSHISNSDSFKLSTSVTVPINVKNQGNAVTVQSAVTNPLELLASVRGGQTEASSRPEHWRCGEANHYWRYTALQTKLNERTSGKISLHTRSERKSPKNDK